MRATTKKLLEDVAAAAIVCTLAAVLFCAHAARAAESAASNLDLMTRLTADVVGELYGKFGASLGDRAVELKPFASGEDYTFVSNVLTGTLTRAGVRTIRGNPPGAWRAQGGGNAALDSVAAAAPAPVAPATPAGALVLQFQNVAFQLAYPDVYRSHVFGGQRVRRRAAVRILATLTDSRSGAVLWMGEAERSHADEFDRDESARVESGAYGFLRPQIPSGGAGKYIEPVFVTGVIVGLIYLFFSNQSDN